MVLFAKQCSKLGLIFLLFIYMLPVSANEQALRYRGKYTYGHEVNTFCPDINSQCYWLNPATSIQIRHQLKQISENNVTKPYQSVCVVLQGDIDRETKSSGFAADYNGLFRVYRVFGLCRQVDIVTQGDLQHHRWVLGTINGVNIELPKQSSKSSYPVSNEEMLKPVNTVSNVLYLEFGEQMQVFASTGCNILSGQSVLREDYIYISIDHSNTVDCSAKDQTVQSLLEDVLASEPKISIDSDKSLLLEGAGAVVKYHLKDWVY